MYQPALSVFPFAGHGVKSSATMRGYWLCRVIQAQISVAKSEVVMRHSASTQHSVLKISGCCQTISLYTWLKVRTSSFESLYLSTICTNNSIFRTETNPISDSCSPCIETKRIYRSNWNGKDNKTSSNLTGRHLQKSLNQKKWQDYLKCIIMSVERVHQNKWHVWVISMVQILQARSITHCNIWVLM